MASTGKSRTTSNTEVEEIKYFSKLVQSTKPGLYKITCPSGNEYEVLGGGVLLLENESDFEYIISRKTKKSCCGGAAVQNIFIVLE